MKYIVIPIEDEDDIIDNVQEEFMAWFLDGGGFESFRESFELDSEGSIYSTYQTRDEWCLEVNNDEHR